MKDTAKPHGRLTVFYCFHFMFTNFFVNEIITFIYLNMIYFPFSAEENLDKTCERYRETPWLYAEDTAQLKAEAGPIFL